jgi:hypothetical protein
VVGERPPRHARGDGDVANPGGGEPARKDNSDARIEQRLALILVHKRSKYDCIAA